jgi:uncharacterized membrane protein
MTELADFIDQWLGFTRTGAWSAIGAVTLVAWVCVRGLLDDSRLRRVLSVVIPLAPVALVALVVALDWPHVRRSISFTRPGWLALLAVLPILVWFSRRSLSGLGPTRQTLSITLRSVILILIAAALAEIQFVRFTERMTVLFLVDHSRSIPEDRQEWVRDYVSRVTQEHLRGKSLWRPGERRDPGDVAGVIFFAKQPRIEIPPVDYIEVRPPEGEYDRDHSDLAAALKLAQGAFPEDTMKRIVLISDGNENRGEALRQAVAAKANGIAIDVLPITYRYDEEVMVEKVTMPPDVHKGETVNLNIVLRAAAPVTGTLRLFEKADNRSSLLLEKTVTLERGVNPFVVQQKIEAPNFYTFEAQFQPAEFGVDRIPTNNRAITHTYIKGAARVLLVEGTPGEHDRLVEALRQEDIEVIRLGSAIAPAGANDLNLAQVPDSLAELRTYDCVILANLPRENLTDRQMEMLAANTHDMGAGLIMIGGPESFGAGGYIDSPIEKAMPVDMQIKSMKIMGKGALVLVMHACEIPQGNHWEKQIAKDAVKTLSYNDEAGCIQSQGAPSWVFPLRQVGDKQHMFARIDRMTPMDMMDFDSVMIPARNALIKSDAMTKHMIVVTDGDPQQTTPAVVKSLVDAKITVTTVGVGVHGQDIMGQRHLANLAKATGGRNYIVTNNKALPKIFQKEARIVSRPLIFEKETGWKPNVVHASEPIAGLTDDLPPMMGLVRTQAKQNELVDVPITSPLPTGTENPVLAHWQYGLGKAVAFTSDAGQKWTSQWTGWDGYQKFWSQLVRWAMRSVEGGNVVVSTQRVEGKIKVVADVLDKDNQFVNFAQIEGVVVAPDMSRRPVGLVQVAPGRYEGMIDDAEAMGTYFITLRAKVPGAEEARITTGVSVPYPQEYKELESNPQLLEQIASITGGKVIDEREAMRLDAATNPFRHDLPPPTASEDIWHICLFVAAALFFFDVAVRRISLDLSRMRPMLAAAWAYARGKQIEVATQDYMAKLRTRKAEVSRQLDEARAARRFEPTPDTPASSPFVLDDMAGSESPRTVRPADRPQVTPQHEKQQETYTSRLLKAKKKVWDEKKT